MRYRLYFHKRNGNDPVVWSLDEGTQQSEIHIQWFHLERVVAKSVRNLEAKDGEPSGWIEIENAAALIQDGGAIITSAL